MRLPWTIAALMIAAAAIPVGVLAVQGTTTLALLGIGGALLVTVVGGVLLSRRSLLPLRECVGEALNISRGVFGTQIELQGHNEISDLTHTFNYMSKQLQTYDLENKALVQSLEQGYLETIAALANSIDSKDSYTRGHSQRVGELSMAIGRELGLPQSELRRLLYGGILHDIGKIGAPERILLKQSRLSDEEMVVMRRHPEIGASIVGPVAFLAPVLPAVRNHHERWDGTGYPDKLKGEQIPMMARIVNVADTWDACTSTRPYQSAMPYEGAMAVLRGLSGSQCDPAVVVALERALQKWIAMGKQVTAAVEPGSSAATPMPHPGAGDGAQLSPAQ
jgi:putative nucleotidyltransferase with HDIG domain